MADQAVETWDELYALARAENWRSDDGKPVTIGWLQGYYDIHFYEKQLQSFPFGSLADLHYSDGVATAQQEISIEAGRNGPFYDLKLSPIQERRLDSMFCRYTEGI